MTTTSPAGISVVTPFYNPGNYLAEAIESILNQELRPGEIILVSDGADEESVKVARRYIPEVKLIFQENKGAGAARNTGIKESCGELLAFLDADDLWHSQKLKLQSAFLMSHPECDMVFCHAEQFISPELPPESKARLRNELIRMPGYVPGTMLIRKEAFLRIGLFNEQFRVGEFIDWYSKAISQGTAFHMMEEILLKRRIHNHNLGIHSRDKLADYTLILRQAIARRRNNPPGNI